MRHYLARFEGKRRYDICYLAMHGEEGEVRVGSEALDLWDLTSGRERSGERPTFLGAQSMSDGTDQPETPFNFRGQFLYLASCSTLASGAHAELIRQWTGAIAVCGYSKPVDWYEAAGFDVMLLSAVAEAMAMKNTRAGLERRLTKLRKRLGNTFLDETLGFVCVPDWR